MSFELAVIVGMGIISFIFIYIASVFKDKNFVLQFLFLFLSLFTILVQADTMGKVSIASPAISGNIYIAYTGYVWGTVFVLVYFVINLIIDIFKGFQQRRGV